MTEFFSADAMSAFLQVIMIDLVLAGDNAVVIGLAAAGLPKEQRAKAILIGIGAATVLRILFALTTTQLLLLGPGLLIAGGLLLLWVCWKMWRELRHTAADDVAAQEALTGHDLNADGTIAGGPRKTFAQAAWQIVIADVSMSLDNVLAVAGAALEHPTVLIFGLVLSIALMGLAANYIARLLQNHRWIAYVGLLIILYVALQMIWEGSHGVVNGETAAALWWVLPEIASIVVGVDVLLELGMWDAVAFGWAELTETVAALPERSPATLSLISEERNGNPSLA